MFKLPYLSYSSSDDTVTFTIYEPNRDTHFTRTFENSICQRSSVIFVWRHKFQAQPEIQLPENRKGERSEPLSIDWDNYSLNNLNIWQLYLSTFVRYKYLNLNISGEAWNSSVWSPRGGAKRTLEYNGRLIETSPRGWAKRTLEYKAKCPQYREGERSEPSSSTNVYSSVITLN